MVKQIHGIFVVTYLTVNQNLLKDLSILPIGTLGMLELFSYLGLASTSVGEFTYQYA